MVGIEVNTIQGVIMTIAIGMKVGDAVVMGTDSATTMTTADGHAVNSYFTGEKMINLVCGLPIGLATYGLGGMSGRSVIRLARDLRAQMGAAGSPLHVDPHRYTMEEVAIKVRQFFFTERYEVAHAEDATASLMGFIIGGYSAGETSPEIWEVQMQGATCGPPMCTVPRDQANGLTFQGQGEALTRLIGGWNHDAVNRLAGMGLPSDQAITTLQTVAPLWHEAMPVQDAIDLVRYLVDVVCGYVRFSPGALTVAPPVDLAAITLHEGFRWVSRKHYYTPGLNPPDKYSSPVHPPMEAP
jgi:hypothetical protein